MYDRPNAIKGKYVKIPNMLIFVGEPVNHEVIDLWRLFNYSGIYIIYDSTRNSITNCFKWILIKWRFKLTVMNSVLVITVLNAVHNHSMSRMLVHELIVLICDVRQVLVFSNVTFTR